MPVVCVYPPEGRTYAQYITFLNKSAESFAVDGTKLYSNIEVARKMVELAEKRADVERFGNADAQPAQHRAPIPAHAVMRMTDAAGNRLRGADFDENNESGAADATTAPANWSEFCRPDEAYVLAMKAIHFLNASNVLSQRPSTLLAAESSANEVRLLFKRAVGVAEAMAAAGGPLERLHSQAVSVKRIASSGGAAPSASGTGISGGGGAAFSSASSASVPPPAHRRQ